MARLTINDNGIFKLDGVTYPNLEVFQKSYFANIFGNLAYCQQKSMFEQFTELEKYVDDANAIETVHHYLGDKQAGEGYELAAPEDWESSSKFDPDDWYGSSEKC